MGCLKYALITVVGLSLCSTIAIAQNGDDYPTYALLVGSKQPGTGQSELQFAHADVDSLRDVLMEIGGYADGSIEVLKDPKPEELFGTLQKLKKQLEIHTREDQDAVFLFYYSGHAKSQALNLGSNDVSLVRLRAELEAIPAKVKVVILDACQAGSISRVKGAQPAEQFSHNSVEGLNTEGMVVMASSSTNELSQESQELGGSFFTHHLVVGLRGAADANSDGRVALREAYKYAYNNTLVSTSETAIGKQHVTLETELKGKGDMVLTWPAEASSRIVFPAELSAEILIFTDPERVVIAEVHKIAGYAMSLALPSRKYSALVSKDGSTQLCEIAPSPEWKAELRISGCENVSPNQVEIKGGDQTAQAEQKQKRVGPKRFYVDVSMGTGLGFVTGATQNGSQESGEYINELGFSQFEEREYETGIAWNGAPLRLSLGLFLNDKLSIELAGRLDLWSPKYMKDVSGEDETYQIENRKHHAWLANVRLRYQLVNQKSFLLSLFGGGGYGRIQYMGPAFSGYFPQRFPNVGMINVTAGMGLRYYFTDYFGVILEVPVDAIFKVDIYTKYGPALARKCERMLGNSNDAEDVVQALFVELIQKEKTDVALPYLYRAATNRCISVLRNRKNRARLLEKQGTVITPSRTTLDEQVISLELLAQLVSKLDKKCAAILVYRYIDGMGHEEIAELLGVTRRTVHNKLVKVRKVAEKLIDSGVQA